VLTEQSTLKEARDWLRGQVKNGGATCPACNQHAKIYRRPLNHVPAASLILLYRKCRNSFGHLGELVEKHIPTIANQGGYIVLSQHWGLIEEEKALRPDGGRVGHWSVTEKGVAFLQGEIRVPKYVHLYDNRVLLHDGPPITIRDALGTRFNYAELMST
jgi:hypothetical protein